MGNTEVLEGRIQLLAELGKHLGSTNGEWELARERAAAANGWFTPAHIARAVDAVVNEYLDEAKLREWAAAYQLPKTGKRVGIVAAGNIPMVGFHDMLCGYVAGHQVHMKLSSKDEVLMKYVISWLGKADATAERQLVVADRLNGCDAYIATGSNNTSRYFEQYFGAWPNIIRRNRTSVAVLTGEESRDELEALADDVYLYFGLGCRNVTQLLVPRGYDFVPLLDAFRKYDDYINFSKYKNNYDYHLALYLLNKVTYMSNDSLLMVENALPFSPVSVLHYAYYDDLELQQELFKSSEDIQAVVGRGFVPFGAAQKPALTDYADGVDTMAFLCAL